MNRKEIIEFFANRWVVTLFVISITLLGFALRLYKLDNPIADWHSWRQADTSAVTRNFVKDGFNPLFPRYDALNPLNEIGHNPNRYFFAEFPLYNIITYFVYQGFGINDAYGRLVSAIFATATIPLLFLLVSHYSNKRVALGAAAIFAVLPYNVYYGRGTMADPLHIFFSVASLLLVSKWLERNNVIYLLLASASFSFAILTKPYALVLLLPIGYLIYRKWGLKLVTQWTPYVFLAVSMIPFLLWRHHINQYPEGMFGTDWLYNQGNIRFTGAYFRWLIFERLNKLIFATGGFALFFIGLTRALSKKEGYMYPLWLVGILAFFVVIARGNVTHDYYQLPIVPVGCIFIALGIDQLITRGANYINRAISIVVAVSLVAVMLAFGWYEVRGYYNINHPEIVEAGKAVDRLLPKDAIVIAPYDNDSAFLYQTNRHGYTFGGDKVEQYIQEGATHMVSVNFDDTTNKWAQRCKIIEKTSTYIILDLRVCTPEGNILSSL